MNSLVFPPGVFNNADGARRDLDSLHEAFIRCGSRFPLADFSAALRGWLMSSPDPDLALTNMLRFVGASFSQASLFNDLLQFPLFGDLLFGLFGFSRYFADVLVREPGLFRWLTSSGALDTPVTENYLRPEIDRVIGTFQKPEKRLDALKRLHRREILRIGAQDILGRAGLVSITEQLSTLADAVVDTALRIAVDQMGPIPESLRTIPYCVIGLGKIGGNELNYSSDIDVMFVYGEEKEEGEHGEPSAFHYFNKLSERLVQNLSQPSAEGHLYRVDTRLRPEAGAGPLARSLAGFLGYYESRGELWERQMLIKARPMAGDRRLGEELLRALEPFVYPRTIFEHPAGSVARIKSRIEAAIGDEANIKLMPGGIRDIEFIVQTLQLVNGGKNPALRERGTLRTLTLLRENGLLSADEDNTLSRAYVLYRTVEHRLQTLLNTQTHILPADEQAYTALARRVGMQSGGEFRQTLSRSLGDVRAIFNQVMTSGEADTPPDILSVVEGGLDEASLHKVLAGRGFRDSRLALRHVRQLTAGSSLTGARTLDTRVRDAFRAVARSLFEEIGHTPDPDRTLAAFTSLGSGQKVIHAFYDQLADPRFRRFVLDICAVSPRFARGLAQYPLLLETLSSDPDTLGGRPDGALPADMDPIEFKAAQELRAGVRHVLGFTDFDQLTDELSIVASGIVESLLVSGPRGGRRARSSLAVFALGKFGTSELGFDADLDLLFVSGEADTSKREAMERLAAQLVRTLTSPSAKGRLYDVDARLRPEGKSAPLVVDAGTYVRYLASRASLWERQSLTRLRFLCGDRTVGTYVTAQAVAFVYDAPLRKGWTEEIVAMRRKMESRSRTRGASFVDIKLGPGGMADIEFIAQMIQMRYGSTVPPLRGMKTVRLLRSGAPGVLSDGEVELLSSAYRMYRRIELLMRIGLEDRGSILPERENLDVLGRLYDGSSGAALESRVAGTMKRVRSAFLEIAGTLEQ